MAAESKKYISQDKLSTHKKPGDLWISIQGKIYNVSDWANHHPGGELPLLSLAGQHVTDAFVAYHPGSAWQHLNQFFTGSQLESILFPKFPKITGSSSTSLRKWGFSKTGDTAFIFSLFLVAMLFTLSVYGALCSDSGWVHLGSSGLMGFLWIQSGWLGHDSGHYQIISSKRVNRFAQILTGNCLAGISIAWWKHNLPFTSVSFYEASELTVGTLRTAALQARDLASPVPKNLVWEAVHSVG